MLLSPVRDGKKRDKNCEAAPHALKRTHPALILLVTQEIFTSYLIQDTVHVIYYNYKVFYKELPLVIVPILYL